MQVQAVPTILPDVAGEQGSLSSNLNAGRYALVWWHPQALSPIACKTCKGGAEPIQLLQEIYEAGCDVIGLTYDSPSRVTRYLQDIGIEYPILTVDENAARSHGVAKVQGESWQSIPHRIAFLVDEHARVINRYDVHDATAFLRTVRDDVKAGPPPSQWKPAKKRRGLFSWR